MRMIMLFGCSTQCVAQKEGVLTMIGVSHNSVVKPHIFDKSWKVQLKFDCLMVMG
jgi:hypothetical protein